VFVVTRWLAGSALSEQLNVGPLTPEDARYVVESAADALSAAAAEGLHHLVLDPRDVLLTDHGVVVVGIGVRAALEGVEPESDAAAVDTWRLGALLYAALTAKWPGYPCAGLEGAPVVGHRVARPRQVRAGVPDDLDEVAWRVLDPDHPDPIESPAELAAALAAPVTSDVDSAGADLGGRAWRWLGLALVLVLFATGAVLVAWQFWQNAERAEPVADQSTAGSPTPSATGDEAGPVKIKGARAFDPAGDNTENDGDAPLAIDGDLSTAWTTVTYATRALGDLKSGVGLALDLGEETSVGGIELRLVGRGSDVQVWAARPATDPRGGPPSTPDPADPLAGYQRLGSFAGTSDLVTLTFSPAVMTDQVVIWFTALPAAEGGYRGGVVEASLVS
jgi:hypothetical protein